MGIAAALAACDALTDVDAPNAVELSALDNALGAQSLAIGATSDFSAALAGGTVTTGQITISGAMADEFASAAAATDYELADLRNVPERTQAFPYALFQRSRVNALMAIDKLKRFSPTPPARIGKLYALSGYTELLFAENLCMPIPLGVLGDGDWSYGTPLSADSLLRRAIADFDSAISYAGDSARVQGLARVGRARALLAIGRRDEAAASVSAVPTSFSYALEYSAATQPNGVAAALTGGTLTVANRDGNNGLDFIGAADPRVPTTRGAKGRDGVTDLFGFTRYASAASPVTLASGIEARLIEAEGHLAAGDATGARTILNTLRSTVTGLTPLTAPATTAAEVDQLFRERAFWLFGTGHRLGDLRRLVQQYGRLTTNVFPAGAHKSGVAFGSQTTLTPDAAQWNNPAYHGCTSRAP